MAKIKYSDLKMKCPVIKDAESRIKQYYKDYMDELIYRGLPLYDSEDLAYEGDVYEGDELIEKTQALIESSRFYEAPKVAVIQLSDYDDSPFDVDWKHK